MRKTTRDPACLSRTLLPRSSSGALEISFGWLFAIVAGIFIIALAIYFSSKIVGTQQEVSSAETATELGTLLDPLETSFESAQTSSVTLSAESRIHNSCDLTGSFGQQIIQIDQKSLNKWTKTDVDVEFSNKYIFSESEIEGKKFYIFSKQFKFPFKIADLIYMTSSADIYCFVDAPAEIKEEISNLNQSNLLTENCSSTDIDICFDSSNCDVNVDYTNGIVEKNGSVMYISGVEDYKALMYAAIFSNKETYECQVERLMMRLKELSEIYADKNSKITGRGCSTNFADSFTGLIDSLSLYSSSEDLSIIKTEMENMDEKNNAGVCMLW